MSDGLFKAGGPLTAEHANIYIKRDAESESLIHLRNKDYLLLIEPRQQGKTSFIYYLRLHPSFSDFAFLYMYLRTSQEIGEEHWYMMVGQHLLDQMNRWFESDKPDLPKDSMSWRAFLKAIAKEAQQRNHTIVISMDEIAAIPSALSGAFFSVLRDIYNSRFIEPEFAHITFILAGTYNPQDLIQDDRISPFNIAHRVRLPDLTLEQVHELVGKGGWPDAQASALSERIHYWTDGQPYLTQLLCSYLGPDATPGDVDTSVEKLRREDQNHLPPLLRRLEQDEKLHEFVRRIRAGQRIKFYPPQHPRQAQLELIGVIKGDSAGYCVIRNRIYEQVLLDIEALDDRVPEEPPQEAFRYDAFISYSREDIDWVRGTLLPRLEREELRVCIDYRDFEPGVPIMVNMENAVRRSHKTLLVLTPNWLKSEWAGFESLVLLTNDPSGRERHLLPLIVRACELPARLKVFSSLDFTKPAEFEYEMQRLVKAIRSG